MQAVGRNTVIPVSKLLPSCVVHNTNVGNVTTDRRKDLHAHGLTMFDVGDNISIGRGSRRKICETQQQLAKSSDVQKTIYILMPMFFGSLIVSMNDKLMIV